MPAIGHGGRHPHLSIPTSLTARVADGMRLAAAEAILPRFRALKAEDIENKSPGEIVTTADRDAERILSAVLKDLLPGAKVVGEELASDQPDVLNELGGDQIWLVDPLDGTANFVEGSDRFAVMVALLRQGEAVASWMLDPVHDILYAAESGNGAFAADRRIACASGTPTLCELRGAILTRFLPATLKRHIEAQTRLFGAYPPGTRAAGVDYPALVKGAQNFVLFWRTLPWDHAAGALFTQEAGGHVARPDGAPYLVTDSRSGLLAAQNKDVWREVQQVLLAGQV